MEGAPAVTPQPRLSGSAPGVWGQHPVLLSRANAHVSCLVALFCSMICFIAISWHIISGVPFVRGVLCIVDWSPCCLDKACVSHNLGLSGIFVIISWHRADIFPVTPKKLKNPVQHAQYRRVAIASLAISLRGGLQSSQS